MVAAARCLQLLNRSSAALNLERHVVPFELAKRIEPQLRCSRNQKLETATCRFALLSDSKSIAFRLPEHCFQTPEALLSDTKSIALASQKHCSSSYRALFWRLQSIALYGYGTLLPKVQSIAPLVIEHSSTSERRLI